MKALKIALLFAACGLARIPQGDVASADPSAADVVRKVRETFARLDDYRVRVRVHVDIEGFDVQDRTVLLYFKSPDRVHLEGADFAMLPREGVMADPSQLFDDERFDIRLSGVESTGGRKTYRLDLFDREWDLAEGESPAPALTAWVDGARWVVVRMEAQAAGKKQGLVTIDHTLVDGKYWLPRQTDVEIYMDNLPATARCLPEADSTARSPQPDRGTIRLTFEDYQVNTGLPDSLFADPDAGLP